MANEDEREGNESRRDEERPVSGTSRRELLKGAVATGVMAAGAAALPAGQASAHRGEGPLGDSLTNPYGGIPGGGISLPSYYRPTPSVVSAANYFPRVETLGADEMRISFLGSTPYPPREDQAGTCIMVELGNGKRFFFDFGSGCVRNVIGMQVPAQMISDIFISHLHVDHYADIPYVYPFRAWSGGYTPLRIHGPSGRTPELGTKAMVDGMKQMLRWHLEAFDCFPIGDGYEIEVNEFDYSKEGGVVLDEDGVVIRSWPRSHAKDGAVGYRLDWNDLSFVWTSDGRPDELSLEYGKGVDVFVTELAGQDVGQLMQYKYGIPPQLFNYTIDTHHTSHYAVGKIFAETNPRLGMVTHYAADSDIDAEMVAGIRAYWQGLFQFGVDVTVINVTKDAIWSREAALPGKSGNVQPFPEMVAAAERAGEPVPKTFDFPNPRVPREKQQDKKYRDMEIDPAAYYPKQVLRDPLVEWPRDFSIDLSALLGGEGDD